MNIMSESIKAGPMECCPKYLFIKDNLDEEVARWQQHDEDRNLEAIDMHEVVGATEHDAAQSFNKEVNRRQSNDS